MAYPTDNKGMQKISMFKCFINYFKNKPLYICLVFAKIYSI